MLLVKEDAGSSQGMGNACRSVSQDRKSQMHAFDQRLAESFVLAHGDVEIGVAIGRHQVLL